VIDIFNYKCDHKYCRQCISDYIINKINISEVENIKCPEGNAKCNNIYDNDLIKSIIPDKEYFKYLKFIRRNEISKIPNSVLCPYPDCDSYGISENINQLNKNDVSGPKQFISCIDKNHLFCIKCLQMPHIGFNCNNKLENDFKKWVKKDKNVKKCPKCSFFIQKNQGCNHMICGNPNCRFEFCWICMNWPNSSHYRNPLSPCFGMQYINQNNIMVKVPFLRFFKLFFTFILIILGLAIFITFFSIIALMIIYNYKFNKYVVKSYKNRKWFKIISILFIIFIGIGLIPVGYVTIGIALGLSPILLPCLILIIKYRM
jgi:hypothetical protein